MTLKCLKRPQNCLKTAWKTPNPREILQKPPESVGNRPKTACVGPSFSPQFSPKKGIQDLGAPFPLNFHPKKCSRIPFFPSHFSLKTAPGPPFPPQNKKDSGTGTPFSPQFFPQIRGFRCWGPPFSPHTKRPKIPFFPPKKESQGPSLTSHLPPPGGAVFPPLSLRPRARAARPDRTTLRGTRGGDGTGDTRGAGTDESIASRARGGVRGGPGAAGW